ncbi:pyrroline-5-carboxylate reductase [Mycobacterium sp. SM1]|uniref:pyrroline-5-carboxylate reductase n=1 Tax=Mycobacterium sp. SM1 TaxID=2816243 RepID=UPI001BCC24B9|nr:pyrroline-5-carboxylate reductase [Mycobacterium sp. SM1]MBS4728633.1 pyrroline-5-carboxylate reductase [Mycobacterium sp. SM1]
MARIAIIGGGSMGEALLSGLLRSGRAVHDLMVAERLADRARYLAETYSVAVAPVSDTVANAAFVIVAVKPTDIESVIGEIARGAARAENEQVFVTVAAGVTTAYLESKLPDGAAVVRAMPNAPALVGAGVTALAKGRFATSEQLKEVSALFEAVGGVLVVAETQLDAVTAVSGSGPAYFFLMVEALVDAAVGVGLSRQVAIELVVRTFAGSAAMLAERIEHERGMSGDAAPGMRVDTTAAQLRASVTSPAGTTVAALRELERSGFRAAVDAAVQAAKNRAEQLRITSE